MRTITSACLVLCVTFLSTGCAMFAPKVDTAYRSFHENSRISTFELRGEAIGIMADMERDLIHLIAKENKEAPGLENRIYELYARAGNAPSDEKIAFGTHIITSEKAKAFMEMYRRMHDQRFLNGQMSFDPLR